MTSKIDSDKQKKIFAKNLNYYMKLSGKNTADLAADLSFPFSTVSDWVHAKKYPRMDKVQTIADYFGILKSHLTEEEPPLPPSPAVDEKEKRTTSYDEALLDQELISRLCKLTPEETEKVDAFVQGLLAAR